MHAGRENGRTAVWWSFGVGLRCCVLSIIMFITPLCMDTNDGACGRSTSRCIVHLLLVLWGGICAILMMIDMEDFEMTMGATVQYSTVPMSAHLSASHELSSGNSRAIHRVLGAFWWKGRQVAEWQYPLVIFGRSVCVFRDCKLPMSAVGSSLVLGQRFVSEYKGMQVRGTWSHWVFP
jgi:hypothetical protein